MAKRATAVDVHVGNTMRDRRKELGMSQTALADAVGLTFQQIQKYEKGTNRMGSSRLHQVAEILKVPIPFFFEGAPGHKTARHPDLRHIEEFAGSAEGKRLIKAFQRIEDRELRRYIVGLVERLSN